MRISDWSSDVCSSDLEPDFALVKFKKLAGGGYFKIINRTVPAALRKLGYEDRQIEAIIAYAVGYGTLADAPAINHETLAAKGFTPEAIEALEKALGSAFDIMFAFTQWKDRKSDGSGKSVAVRVYIVGSLTRKKKIH